MESTLLGVGILCIVAAIVGGGVRLLGAEIPVIASATRQLILFVFGLALILASRVADSGQQSSSGVAKQDQPADTSVPDQGTLALPQPQSSRDASREFCDSLTRVINAAPDRFESVRVPKDPSQIFLLPGETGGIRLPNFEMCSVSSPGWPTFNCALSPPRDAVEFKQVWEEMVHLMGACLPTPGWTLAVDSDSVDHRYKREFYRYWGPTVNWSKKGRLLVELRRDKDMGYSPSSSPNNPDYSVMISVRNEE